MNENKKTSVIIVGAGPVGLGLACDLGQRGVDCVLIEKRDGAINVPKQSMVSARNMEFCRRWGVAKTVRTAVWPESHLARLRLSRQHARQGAAAVQGAVLRASATSATITPETACPCPQIYFDPILGNHARTLPSVTLAYNTRLDSFSQDDDGVTAQVTDMTTGAAQTLRAQYLVGCDGPSGIVREALGIGIEGSAPSPTASTCSSAPPSLATSHDKGWARFYRVIDETGCWAELIPIDGKELWRLTVFDEPLSKADPDFLLRKMTGGAFPYEMLIVSPWERRDYVARSYGQGRIFIAGDAAHECSPTGGIGMHTGLEEAVNLGWKLAALTEGWGGPALLASYEIERRPIAVRNVELATHSYNAIAAIPGWREGMTDWKANPAWLSIPEHIKLQLLLRGLADLRAGRHAAACRWIRRSSCHRPGPARARRMPGSTTSARRSTCSATASCCCGSAPIRPTRRACIEAAKARGVPMRAVTLADPDVAALYETRLVLVRPDGHVAWRGNECPADAADIVDRIRGAAGVETAMPDRPREADAPRAHLL